MDASTVLLLLLVLACPLSMAWMMRSGHGHGGHSHRAQSHDEEDVHAALMSERSTRGLHELRDEIDQMIEERERAEGDQAESEPETATWSRK